MKFLILFALALATTSVVPISAIKGRISNGIADISQFPYHVGLNSIKGPAEVECSGSLIGNSWVLTTANCMKNMEKVYVYLGANKFGSFAVSYTVNSSAFIIHSGYNRTTRANDIALIQIPYTNFTTNINKVKLPPMSSSYPTYEGSNATATYWAYSMDTYKDLYLQWVSMPVINNTECNNNYQPFITSSTICLAPPSPLICQGDSGGPLVLGPNKTLIGVYLVSYGYCASGYPVAFTRVDIYLDWILNAIL